MPAPIEEYGASRQDQIGDTPEPEFVLEIERRSPDASHTHETAFHWLALVIFALFLIWPMLSIVAERKSVTLLSYVTVIWLLMIVAAVLLARRIARIRGP